MPLIDGDWTRPNPDALWSYKLCEKKYPGGFLTVTGIKSICLSHSDGKVKSPDCTHSLPFFPVINLEFGVYFWKWRSYSQKRSLFLKVTNFERKCFSKLLLNMCNIFTLSNLRKHTLTIYSLKMNFLLLKLPFLLFRKYLLFLPF